MENSSAEGNKSKYRPSFTAMVQSGIRFAGCCEKAEPICGDHLGYLFQEHPYKLLRYPSTHFLLRWMVEQRWPGGYGYSCCRSRIGDVEFESFLQGGGKQIVNLGAGFCTRNERFANMMKDDTTAIEVDLAPSQNKKKKIMAEHCPSGFVRSTYLAADFEKDSIADVLLSSHKYSQDEITLFLWEGVSMYIESKAVDDVFAFIRHHSARGSRIVFDYVFLDYVESHGNPITNQYFGGDRVYNATKERNEPLLFGIPNGGLKKWLEERGFSLVGHWTGSEMEEQFLKDSKGISRYRADGPFCACIAELVDKQK